MWLPEMTRQESFRTLMTARWLEALESLWTSFRSWLQLYYHHPLQRRMNWKCRGAVGQQSFEANFFGKISGRVSYSALPGWCGMPAHLIVLSLISESLVRFRVTWIAHLLLKSVIEESWSSFAFIHVAFAGEWFSSREIVTCMSLNITPSSG